MTENFTSRKQLANPCRYPIHPSVLDKLDPAFVKLYHEQIEATPPLSGDINIVRRDYSGLYPFATAPPSGVGGIGETQVPGWDTYPGDIGVRVYVPPGEEPGVRKVWPVHFNFHGGGWVMGDLDTDAHICHHICAAVPCCVIDIDYRLCPEFPFPTGIMDGLTAILHVLSNHSTFMIDPKNVTVGGSSTGATIALILNHLLRDKRFGDRLKGVVVGTPIISDITQFTIPEQSPWPSMKEFQHAPLLDWATLKWLDTLKWKAPKSETKSKLKRLEPDMSWFTNPSVAPDFHEMAPITWIGTAEVDPTRDEAESYANKVRDAGNRVILKRYNGVPHPFMRMDKVLVQGQEYVQDVISRIRMCLYPAQPTDTPVNGSATL